MAETGDLSSPKCWFESSRGYYGKTKEYQIPFVSVEGVPHMLEYVSYYGKPHEWRDNKPFDADLELVSHYRGRSAARVRVRNTANGEIYSFGFGALYDAITTFKVQGGVIVGGTYMFRKQGSNYGLVPVKN